MRGAERLVSAAAFLAFLTVVSAPVAAQGGEAIYRENCRNCHGESGEGTMEGQPDFTNSSFWRGETQAELIEEVKDGAGGMPAFEGVLSEEEIRTVLEYESGLAGVDFSELAGGNATGEDTATATPTETPTPGFTALFAVAGLLAVTYAVARRR